MPYVKGVDRNQTTLFPESIEDYITSDNQVRVIDAYVEQLDMVALNFNYAIYPDVGRPPYNPKVILKLYLYGCLNRVRSSRYLELEAKRLSKRSFMFAGETGEPVRKTSPIKIPK